MKKQTFINSHRAHPRRWQPGQDPTPWFDPVKDLIERQNQAIELQRQHGFVENHTFVSADEPWVPGKHYPEAKTITKLEQSFHFEIDFEGVFHYQLHTDVYFEPPSEG